MLGGGTDGMYVECPGPLRSSRYGRVRRWNGKGPVMFDTGKDTSGRGPDGLGGRGCGRGGRVTRPKFVEFARVPSEQAVRCAWGRQQTTGLAAFAFSQVLAASRESGCAHCGKSARLAAGAEPGRRAGHQRLERLGAVTFSLNPRTKYARASECWVLDWTLLCLGRGGGAEGSIGRSEPSLGRCPRVVSYLVSSMRDGSHWLPIFPRVNRPSAGARSRSRGVTGASLPSLLRSPAT